MPPNAAEFFVPRILVVDDEPQIHASVRLRLSQDYELVCCSDAREALGRMEGSRFDLCIVDIHMPHLDGFAFIEAARALDPQLGYLILSAFDSHENLRRAIPLQVYDFIPKPLPEREGFEHRIPEWIERTRRGRSERALASGAGTLARDLNMARLDREVELVASETARDALQQTAGLLTTIHAHLVTATWSVSTRAKGDPTLVHLLRSVEEARKIADSAVTTAGSFFDTAYGSRESSPALVGSGLRHAASIACRVTRADAANKIIDLCALDDRLPIRELTGIDFLLLMTPLVGLALALAAPNTTIRIEGERVDRAGRGAKDDRLRDYFWVNRKAFGGQAGMCIAITASAPPLTRVRAEAWLKGEDAALSELPACGVVAGLQKCRGALGIALSPFAEAFQLLVKLPT